MLSFLGFLIIIIFMVIIIKKKMSPLTALVLIPICVTVLAGFGPELPDMMRNGLTKIGPTGVMLIFAILYFSLMIDTGLFEPLINAILKAIKNDPVKIALGTALLTTLVSLDGDGSTTYLIVFAAFFPLYKKQGMNPLVLTCIVMLTGCIMNILPWDGPTARVMSSQNLSHSQVFVPLIPVMAVGLVWVYTVSYFLGKREAKRIERDGVNFNYNNKDVVGDVDETLQRPKLLVFNLILTFILLTVMVLDIIPLPIAFIIAFCIAAMINYPKLQDQQKIFARHSGNALSVAGMIFGAGIFTGILQGTGIMQAMGNSMIEVVPDELGSHLSVITVILSVPLTFFLNNDAYYYGILPIVISAGEHLNIAPEVLGRASLIGQASHLLSPLVPSTYLLVSLAGVEFGDHLKFTLKWALGSCVVMLLAALAFGVI